MGNTIEDKLNALLNLQAIDCALDDITNMRGVLPEEVASLENELKNLQVSAQSIEEELATLQQDIDTQRANIKDTSVRIKKYEEQQMNVRNNREYDAITKEIDLQKLEMQLAEKKVKHAYEQIDKQKLIREQHQGLIEKQQQLLADKKDALQVLIDESLEEEQDLHGQRQKLVQHIEESLLKAYERIREKVRNQLAVVTVEREACGGCFSNVPPQKQADIKEKQHIIVCEHCGRILADVVELDNE